MVRDKSHVEAGVRPQTVRRHGLLGRRDRDVHPRTIHHDALRHSWYDDQLLNGFGTDSTAGELDRCGAENLADHGTVRRAVLLDVARYRGVDRLERGGVITAAELDAVATEQGVSLETGDIVLVRIGALVLFYDAGSEAFYEAYSPSGDPDTLDEPGPTYTEKTAAWFSENDVAVYETKTPTAEQTHLRETGTLLPLHPALLRDLGVVITELLLLEDVAAAYAEDGRYELSADH
jgi:hypothetical protein